MSTPPEVDPAAPKRSLVAQRHPQRAVTAHAQSRDGASLARRNRQVAGIDPVGQLLRHEGLELRRRIEGTIPIPTVGTVGADDDHPAGIGQRAQVGDVLPRRVRTAETMQQVEHGMRRPTPPSGTTTSAGMSRRIFALKTATVSIRAAETSAAAKTKSRIKRYFLIAFGIFHKKGHAQGAPPDNKPRRVIFSPAWQWSRASAYRP